MREWLPKRLPAVVDLYHSKKMDFSFDNHLVPLEKDTQYYMVSDGLTDQMSGDKRRAFGKRCLKGIVQK